MRDFNIPGCECGEDHNSLLHIARAVINGVIHQGGSVEDAALTIEHYAIEAGWTHPTATPEVNPDA